MLGGVVLEKPIVIDLFCGAGGMSEGFRQAGFDVVCGIDFDKDACRTHRTNFPEAATIEGDITQLSIEDIEVAMKHSRESVDVVIGGFPCQGFSMAGKRWVDDPRNQLFREFVRVVEGFQPTAFVAENVVGLVSMAEGQFVREIKDAFNSIGYEVEVKILNSDDYGVPQKRRRAIFIGNRVGIPIEFPLPTHSRDGIDLKSFVTVGEAIDDLPPLGERFGENEATYIPSNNLPYQQYMRGDITFEEYQADIHTDLKKEERLLYNHWTSKSKGMTLERFGHIGQGENWSVLPQQLQTKGKYSNLYRRLNVTTPSVTLTNIRKSMFIHPYENRLLTVREGARIQSFPDHMIFEGNLGRQQQQIGNAVPPLLGYAIAKKLLADYSHEFVKMV